MRSWGYKYMRQQRAYVTIEAETEEEAHKKAEKWRDALHLASEDDQSQDAGSLFLIRDEKI